MPLYAAKLRQIRTQEAVAQCFHEVPDWQFDHDVSYTTRHSSFAWALSDPQTDRKAKVFRGKTSYWVVQMLTQGFPLPTCHASRRMLIWPAMLDSAERARGSGPGLPARVKPFGWMVL